MKIQPILPDRLRAKKQRTYLKKKELEAEEMLRIEGEPILKHKTKKSRIVPKKVGLRWDP